jgi:transcriptional regulator with XRE-family HTH domain
MAKFSDQLRQAVLDSGMSRYHISAKTGIAESTLSKFVHGTRGISLDSIDKLVDVLKLQIRSKVKRGD